MNWQRRREPASAGELDVAAGQSAQGSLAAVPSTSASRRRLFAGAPRPLLALGVAALGFVIVATFMSLGYGRSQGGEALTQAQIRRLIGRATSALPIGFHRLDRPAPTFTLPPVIGSRPVDLAQLTGKPLVVNFWYSTCPPCEQEAPALAAVSGATRGKVTFVGVDYEDSRQSAAAFIRSHHEDYPDAFDASGKVATQLFGIPGTPTTYFLSPNGQRELGVQIGAVTEAGLAHDLHALYGVNA
jgi:thiol-disulfide isomerase/thioredoxin